MSGLHGATSPRWYVVHTHVRQENRAESNLRAWNVETFVPRYRRRRRNQFRAEPIYYTSPLFSRYIFVRFSLEEMLRNVRFTRGVHSVVCVGDMPAPVDDELIAMIKARSDADGFVSLEDDLKPGDEVLVKYGHFTGFAGVFERRMKDSERVMILLKTVTGQVRIVEMRANIAKT
jgi:transcriptional antiterminator RfaH